MASRNTSNAKKGKNMILNQSERYRVSREEMTAAWKQNKAGKGGYYGVRVVTELGESYKIASVYSNHSEAVAMAEFLQERRFESGRRACIMEAWQCPIVPNGLGGWK